MKSPVEVTERIYLRFAVVIVGGLVLVILCGWGGLRVYHRWQERHLVRRAAGFLAGGDVKTASLNARRAFQLNPGSADAARMLAQLAQRTGDGAEIDWRRKVLELLPDSIDDALALVRAALRANDLATAERTLQRIAPRAQNVATYHAALGRLAATKRNNAEAETHWAKAVELAPNDGAFKTQLALVQLTSGDPLKRDGARRALEQLRSDPEQRAAATRALIMDGASRPSDPQRLRSLAGDLQAYPDATFNDRLLFAEILRQLHDPDFVDYLKSLQENSRSNAADLATLIGWMTSNIGASEALDFAKNAPAEMLRRWPVPLAVAEAYAKANDWAGLQQLATQSDWGGYNFMRHAYLARAMRGQDDQLGAGREWTQAEKEASAQPRLLLTLANTVAGWDWQKERQDLLWNATKAHDTRMEALQELYSYYAKNGDSSGVYRVLLRSLEVAPDDLTIQNNFAQVSLLLDADSERARKIAAELVRKQPKNASYVSTYAFSLYTEGDIAGAMDAFQTLSDEQRQSPAIALYYGIILQAAGDKEKASEYLARAGQAFLLPEEKALLAKAEAATRE